MADLENMAPCGSYALGFRCTEAAERERACLRLHRPCHAAFVSFKRINDETCW